MSSLDLRYKMLCKKDEDSGRLPRGYQEVEYVQGNGGQYIDTGIYGSRLLNFEIDIQQNAVGSAIRFAARNKSAGYAVWISTNSSGYILFAYSNQFYEKTTQIFNDGNWHTWKLVNGKLYIDNTLISDRSGYGSFTVDYTMFLFATNWAGAKTGGAYRISRCQFSLVGQTDLIRDFVPCYRKSDGEIGLYDLVNDVFYTNQGTGTFIKGNDIK